jgi:hypothetical protein
MSPYVSLAALSYHSRLCSNIMPLEKTFLAVLTKIAPVCACPCFSIFVQRIWHNCNSRDVGWVGKQVGKILTNKKTTIISALH